MTDQPTLDRDALHHDRYVVARRPEHELEDGAGPCWEVWDRQTDQLMGAHDRVDDARAQRDELEAERTAGDRTAVTS